MLIASERSCRVGIAQRNGDTVRPNERVGVGVAETRDVGDVFSRWCLSSAQILFMGSTKVVAI